MKRALEDSKEPIPKKPLRDPISGHKVYAKLRPQKHSRLFTHANVRGILMSCIQNREAIATYQLLRILRDVKELLRSEFPEFEEFQAITTSASLDSGHHQQEYFDKNKDADEGDKSEEEEAVETGTTKTPSSFQVYNSGCKGLVFIGIRHNLDAVAFVQRFMEVLARPTEETGIKWPNDICVERILPIQKTSATTVRQITEAIKPMIDQHLGEDKEPTTWGIIAHSRNNPEFPRKAIIDLIASLVAAKHRVNLSNPTVNIIVEVIKSTCCFSFSTQFAKFAKYNPSAFLKLSATPTTLAQDGADHSTSADKATVETKSSAPA
jgi:tRNA(Ser,Leu) C12 N-acetylase TAN1